MTLNNSTTSTCKISTREFHHRLSSAIKRNRIIIASSGLLGMAAMALVLRYLSMI